MPLSYIFMYSTIPDYAPQLQIYVFNHTRLSPSVTYLCIQPYLIMPLSYTFMYSTIRDYVPQLHIYVFNHTSGVARGGVWGVQTPHPKTPKALQNCAKLNPICENC